MDVQREQKLAVGFSGVYLSYKTHSKYFLNEGRRAFKIDSDDEPHTSKKDEVDRAVILFKPMVSEPIHIHRKSPLPRSRKMATNEVSIFVRACFFNEVN